MRAWRIAKKKFALDRSGVGGTVEGGRWHQQGTPVIYAGLSAEICALEKLAHTGSLMPADLVLVALELPDNAAFYETAPVDTLPGWDSLPPGPVSIGYGAAFLRSARALGLIVPSVLVAEAKNIVLNPLHPDFAAVSMRIVRAFNFDARLRDH